MARWGEPALTINSVEGEDDDPAEDGASWNVSASLKNLAKAGWDAIKSIGVGVKGGDSSKVAGGKAEFSCPGVEVLDTIRITPQEYDRRYGINATKHFTPEGETAPAFAPAVSGNLELGENSVSLDIPNVMIPGQKTETTSQQITRRDIEAYLAWLSEQRLSNDEFLNEMARHIRQLKEGGAHEGVLDQWKEQYEEYVNALTTDPVDISDYSAPYVEDEDDQRDAPRDETPPAANGGGGEEETHPHTDPAEGGEYSETPDSIKQSPIWQLYDEEGKEIANDYYRLQKEEEHLEKRGVPSDAPERVALRDDMRNIVDYMKQSGYLGQNEEGYRNMAQPGEKDYYLPEEGLDHFMPEFWFGGGRVVQRTFRAGQWIYQRLTTSKAEASPSGNSLESIKGELQEYLGSGYRTITNKSGDKIFLSKDGNRCVRFDVKNSHGDKPHMHLQYFNGKKWLDATSKHRIHFKDK